MKQMLRFCLLKDLKKNHHLMWLSLILVVSALIPLLMGADDEPPRGEDLLYFCWLFLSLFYCPFLAELGGGEVCDDTLQILYGAGISRRSFWLGKMVSMSCVGVLHGGLLFGWYMLLGRLFTTESAAAAIRLLPIYICLIVNLGIMDLLLALIGLKKAGLVFANAVMLIMLPMGAGILMGLVNRPWFGEMISDTYIGLVSNSPADLGFTKGQALWSVLLTGLFGYLAWWVNDHRDC